MKRLLSFLVAAALAAGLAVPAHAAATAQTTHAFLCRPVSAGTAAGPGRAYNPNTTTAYSLNAAGCGLVAAADLSYFLAQGYTYGPSTFVLQQTGMTASTTATTSTITLPAYAYVLGIALSETAGNAITGGVDIGNATSATAYASAVTVGANADVAVADSALTRIYPASGNPVAEKVLVVCHTSCNSGSLNITILYTYF